MTETKQIKIPHELGLLQKKAHLEAEIIDLQAQKVQVQREAADKLTSLPAGANTELARKSALAPLGELDAHIQVLTLAVADVCEAIAQAPALAQEFQHEAKALKVARGRLDRLTAEAVAALENFLTANNELVLEYRRCKMLSADAMNAWERIGRPEGAPSLPRFQWPPELYAKVRAVSLLQIVLTGDTSGLPAQ